MGLWLAFFREHFASFVSLIVLLPLTLFINWRYGAAADRAVRRVRHADRAGGAQDRTLQSTVERYYSDVAERTSDTLGNIALVQSFARIEAKWRA